MWSLLLLTWARPGAEPVVSLVGEVTVDPAPWTPVLAPKGPRPPVPVGTAAVTIDGDLSDWSEIPESPPLQPLLDGPSPPAARARVAFAADAVSVLLPRIAGMEQEFLVDPEGTSQRWYVVSLHDDVARARVCTLADVVLPVPASTPSRAAPCAPVDVRGMAGESGFELRLSVPRVTTAAGLGWWVTGPTGGGTWAPFGKSLVAPNMVRRVTGLGEESSVKVTVDHRVWTLAADPTLTRWRRSAQGRLVDEGEIINGSASLPASDLPDLVIEAAGPGAIARAAVVTTRAAVATCRLATPVASSTLSFVWEASPGATFDVTLARAGTLLGTGVVEVPEGTGTFSVPFVGDAREVEVRCAGPRSAWTGVAFRDSDGLE